jgi:hypothetical protein
MTPRIVTDFVCPPIPWRNFDWQAWDDNLGADASPIGHGATRQEAIDDFLYNWNEAQDATHPAN